MHERQAIREAVAAALVAADTAACGRVYTSRVNPLRRAQEYPAICVYILGETVDEIDDHAPREYVRRGELMVEGWVSPREPCEPDDIPDALDDLALEIETAMNLDPSFGAAAEDSLFEGTSFGLSDEGKKHVGFIGLKYSAIYRTQVIDTDTLDDLETVQATYNLANDQAVDEETGDTITIPTS